MIGNVEKSLYIIYQSHIYFRKIEMKKKILTRQKLRDMQPEIISIDSSSEQHSCIQIDNSQPNPSILHCSQKSSSLSGSDSYQSDSSQLNILQNLAPTAQQKKHRSLSRLLSFEEIKLGSFNNERMNSLGRLNKAEVDALYRHVDDGNSVAQEQNLSHEGNYLLGKNGEKTQDKYSKFFKFERNEKKRAAPIIYSEYQEQNNEISKDLSNGKPRKKPKLMEQLEADLAKPTEQLSLQVDPNFKINRRKQNRKREYLFQKKQKQLKLGKKKDQMSNTVFNAIQDYFN